MQTHPLNEQPATTHHLQLPGPVALSDSMSACPVPHTTRDLLCLAAGAGLGVALYRLLARRSPTASPCGPSTPAPSPSSSLPECRLTYLDIKGVAEPIRLALFVGGVHFEDRRVSYEEIAAMRADGTLAFGQVPMLELRDAGGGFAAPHAQSAALLRWAGRRVGWLYPPEHQLRCDAVEEALADIKVALRPQWYGHCLGRSPVSGAPLVPMTEAQKAETARLLGAEVLPARFAQLERLLRGGGGGGAAPGGPYFCGAALTVCDLSFYVLAAGLLDGSFCAGIEGAEALLDACPGLRALLEAVAAHPKVAEWNAMQHGNGAARC